ncbi:hypothetical protein AB0399_24250 [Streptomyces sp. NPDC088194]|uniref:hypothetical protein n=1 Tax=Streptomyces sp. NPDC088194 TaxID=3154931 RepID=UPI00344E6454
MHGFPRGSRHPGATAVGAVATLGADFADHFPDRAERRIGGRLCAPPARPR